MIFRKRLGEIVNDLPSVTDASGVACKVKYHWGEFGDLISYLNTQEAKYPLIWLESGEDAVDLDLFEVVRNKTVLHIATKVIHTDKNNLYQTETAFKNFLEPIENNLVKGLQRSVTSEIIGSYSRLEKTGLQIVDGGSVVESWNSIRLIVKIKFNNNCFKPVNYD